ncbi:MAG: hypothetical protein NVSMB2_06130 [Chloroflexota bacterium]
MKHYNRPALIEYGRVGELTLGVGGSLPDLLGLTVVTNNSCPTALNTDGTVRIACINAS